MNSISKLQFCVCGGAGGWIHESASSDHFLALRGDKSIKTCPHELVYVRVFAKSLQSRLTLCDPIDCSPPGSSVHGILLARILEWVAVPSFRGTSWPRSRNCVCHISCTGRRILYLHHLGSPWPGLLCSILEMHSDARNVHTHVPSPSGIPSPWSILGCYGRPPGKGVLEGRTGSRPRWDCWNFLSSSPAPAKHALSHWALSPRPGLIAPQPLCVCHPHMWMIILNLQLMTWATLHHTSLGPVKTGRTGSPGAQDEWKARALSAKRERGQWWHKRALWASSLPLQNWTPEWLEPWRFRLELRMAGWLALYLALKYWT